MAATFEYIGLDGSKHVYVWTLTQTRFLDIKNEVLRFLKSTWHSAEEEWLKSECHTITKCFTSVSGDTWIEGEETQIVAYLIQNRIIWLAMYKMQLHEILQIDQYMSIMRVPGGWLYRIGYGKEFKSTFVPYSDEFSTGQKAGSGIPD